MPTLAEGHIVDETVISIDEVPIGEPTLAEPQVGPGQSVEGNGWTVPQPPEG